MTGIDLKGKCPGVTRIPAPKTLDDLGKLLPMIFNLVSKESSQEVVIDDLATVLRTNFQRIYLTLKKHS